MRLRVPGKLIVAGEYAVLVAGEPGLAVAIDQPLYATINQASSTTVSIPALGLECVGPGGDLLEKAPFVEAAISRTAHYLESQGIQPMPFHLLLEGDAQKRGLGGSAQSTVATVAALLAYTNQLERTRLYKLSALSHAHVQGSGSGLDVAAIVYGGWVSYTSPGQHRLASGEMDQDWGPLAIDPIEVPYRLLIGWTGQAASTPAFIRAMASQEMSRFLAVSRDAVEQLAWALAEGDFAQARRALEQARDNLRELGERAQVAIETPLLARLADIAHGCGGTGKLSGAGGGDCGIALAADDAQAACILQGWRQAGIQPLDLAVDPLGTRLIDD